MSRETRGTLFTVVFCALAVLALILQVIVVARYVT